LEEEGSEKDIGPKKQTAGSRSGRMSAQQAKYLLGSRVRNSSMIEYYMATEVDGAVGRVAEENVKRPSCVLVLML
jgi:hypothetical protein